MDEQNPSSGDDAPTDELPTRALIVHVKGFGMLEVSVPAQMTKEHLAVLRETLKLWESRTTTAEELVRALDIKPGRVSDG